MGCDCIDKEGHESAGVSDNGGSGVRLLHRGLCRCFGKDQLALLRLPACQSQRAFVRLAQRLLFAAGLSQGLSEATRGLPQLRVSGLCERQA